MFDKVLEKLPLFLGLETVALLIVSVIEQSVFWVGLAIFALITTIWVSSRYGEKDEKPPSDHAAS